MQRYELVFILDASLTDAKRQEITSKVEETLWSWILEKDEIWLLNLKYKLGWVSSYDKAYFYSYFVEIQAKELGEIKKLFLYNKSILRYAFYKMSKTAKFLNFKNVNEELEKIIESRGENKKLNSKMSFFSNNKNTNFLAWKSLPILQKYISRFWELKPRKYTANNVSTQKKLRSVVIRARELWVLQYVK